MLKNLKDLDLKRSSLYLILIMLSLLLWHDWQKEYRLQPQQESVAQEKISLKNQLNKININKNNNKNIINIFTDHIHATIDLSTGMLNNISLLDYKTDLHTKQPVMLLSSDKNHYYQANINLFGFFPERFLTYQSDQQNYTLQPNQKDLVVTLTAQSSNHLLIKKIFIFHRNNYRIDINYYLENQNSAPHPGYFQMAITRDDAAPMTDSTFRIHTFYGFALSTVNEHYKTYSFKNLRENPLQLESMGGWFGITQHYFLTSWIPESKLLYSYLSQFDPNTKLYTVTADSEPVTIQPGDNYTFKTKLYAGPKIAENLKSTAPYLDLTINYGWLWPISIILFKIMSWIHDLLHNWGWSIIFTTALIKLIFWRFSSMSYRSMAKLKFLQPKVQALKERCGDDRQRFSHEMMALYRHEKVNPLGGCLPVLIQIPFFIALYWVLIASVELQQAPFIFWIKDLASKDPYYILPLLMGATIFIQQQFNPAPPDPAQAQVLRWMPVFMIVIFINFPSGLILYMIVNNLLSILQQFWITKFYKPKVKKSKLNKK